MAYAKLANLSAQFGLYSSVTGVFLYWIFGTSKDISIGLTAVVSILTGNILDTIQQNNPEYESYVIASALALMVGYLTKLFWYTTTRFYNY